MSLAPLIDFMARGGPALWVIAALSVLTLALFLWRLTELAQGGAWRKPLAETWIAEWSKGGTPPASPARTPLDRVAKAAMRALLVPEFSAEAAEKETTRIAKAELAILRRGLRPLELIAATAPLVGLLGTVLGMIGAFQIATTLLHEQLHEGPDTGTHQHDFNFYQTFHDLTALHHDPVGVCADRMVSVFISKLKQSKKKLSKNLLARDDSDIAIDAIRAELEEAAEA